MRKQTSSRAHALDLLETRSSTTWCGSTLKIMETCGTMELEGVGTGGRFALGCQKAQRGWLVRLLRQLL